MSTFDSLRIFINNKQREHNLQRKDIAEAAGISTSTLSSILKKQPQLSLQSLLGIAGYFNCSIDEVLGRKEYTTMESINFKKIDLVEAMVSLKEFVKDKLEETHQNIHKLSENCGLNQTTLNKFMKSDSSKVSISGTAAIALADYFQVSLDEIIGRKAVVDKTTTLETERPSLSTDKIPKLLKDFNAQDLQIISDIQKTSVSQASVQSNRIGSTNIIKQKHSAENQTKPLIR